MLRVTFIDEASRDAFADRFKITTKVNTNQLDIDWHFLQFAKLDDKAIEYTEVAVLTAAPGSPPPSEEREFIVRGNPAVFEGFATVMQDLGDGFYLVKSTDGCTLGDHVDSIEHNSAPVKYLAVSKPNELHGEATTLGEGSDWARTRLASRYRPIVSTFSKHDVDYKSKPELIIMDSGIDFGHSEFAGIETENFYTLPQFNGNFSDDVGHGTAVASLACGKNLGVASNVKLVNCKIGSASYSANLVDLGLAIDAIVARASADLSITRIVNMSWGIARSAWLDNKVESLINMGITVVCAAGNDGISVEDISPAGMNDVITVGSIDKYDIPSGFNNISPSDSGLTTGFGLSLDIFAPGEGVTVADRSGANNYVKSSGTSFSAPLVAGVAAELASLQTSMVPFAEIKRQISVSATSDALLFEDDRFSSNQNKLIYLITTDPNVDIKDEGKSLYMGVCDASTTKIVANLNSVALSEVKNVFPDDPISWSLEWVDPAIEAKYAEFLSLDSVTGILTIQEPTVALPEDTKLELVQFRGVITTNKLVQKTANIFFFHVNPAYKTTLEQSDISLALTNTNSISFFASWGTIIK
jgi:hypothetical protein